MVYYTAMFLFSFSIIATEIIFLHTLLIVTSYISATFVISIAMFGIASGSVFGFYLLRIKSYAIIYLCSLLFILTLGLSYYNIVNIGVLKYPFYLILPFFFGSIIVGTIFSKVHSNPIYFTNLTGSALGVIFPVIFIPMLKSENALIAIVFIPLIGMLVTSFGFRKLYVNLPLALISIILIFYTGNFLSKNMHVPTKIKVEKFEKNIIPKLKNKSDKKFMEKVFHLDKEKKIYQFKATTPYDKGRVKYLLGAIKYKKYYDLNFDIKCHSSLKRLFKIYCNPDKRYTIRLSEDSLLGRVELLAYDDKNMVMAINGVILDQISRGNGTLRDPRVPHLSKANVFIVGLSADGIVKSAKRLPGSKVSGIELNPTILRIMQEDGIFRKFSNHAYKNLGVNAGEGRYFLESKDRKYDMITLMNIHPEFGPISTLTPEYFHTVEGTKLLLNKITDRGFVVYEEILYTRRAKYAFIKFITTAYHAMKEMGIKDPSQHMIVFGWDFWSKANLFRTVMFKRTPFTKKDLRKFQAYYALLKNKYDPDMWLYPGRKFNNYLYRAVFRDKITKTIDFPRIFEPSHFEEDILNKLEKEEDKKFITSVYKKTGKWGIYRRKKKIDDETKKKVFAIFDKVNFPYEIEIKPTTDDRPFPFDVFKNKWEISRIMRLVLIFSMLLFIPVLALNVVKFRKYKFSLFVQIIYFAGTGLGYMLVQIALMQKYQRFIGNPAYSFVVILGGLLLFSGIGSLVSKNWKRKTVIICLAFIPIILLLKLLFLDHVFSWFGKFSFSSKLFISSILLFPLTFLMGLPFPHALEYIKKEKAEEYGTLMFGISGAFSTIGATLSILTSVNYGFQMTFFIGLIAYSIGLGIFLTFKKA